jgi:hypothetical protein
MLQEPATRTCWTWNTREQARFRRFNELTCSVAWNAQQVANRELNSKSLCSTYTLEILLAQNACWVSAVARSSVAAIFFHLSTFFWHWKLVKLETCAESKPVFVWFFFSKGTFSPQFSLFFLLFFSFFPWFLLWDFQSSLETGSLDF